MRYLSIPLALWLAGTSSVWSAPAVTISGACTAPSSTMTAEKAEQFLAQPDEFLTNFKDGQGALASAVRDLVMMRPETIEGIRSMSQSGSPDQNRAIGSGLGTAAVACALSQPATAQRIQEAVLKTNNPDLANAFVTITGDIPTEAVIDAAIPDTGDSIPGGGLAKSATQGLGGVLPANTLTPSSSIGAASNNTATGSATTALFTVTTNSAVLGSVSPAE